MLIRIEAACAGDGWSYKHGDVLEYDKDIPKDRARMLLNGGLATPVRDQPIESISRSTRAAACSSYPTGGASKANKRHTPQWRVNTWQASHPTKARP